MRCLMAAVLVLALTGMAHPSKAAEESREAERLQRAAEVINEVMGTPEKGIPRGLLNKAVCVGVVPSQKKLALGFGGQFGRGALVCRRGGNGAWGAPSMFTIRGGSFGLQLGGSATDVVFVVMNSRGVQKLLKSKAELGADASAAAGPVGRNAALATDVLMTAEILTYSRSKGLFAGVSLKGSAVTQDHDANERLYGRKVDPKDIVISGTVGVPAAARPLDAALMKYSPHGGEKFVQ